MPPNTNLHTYTLMHLRTKKSQALVLILLILAVFGALAGGIAVMWESEIRTRTADRDGLIAFYLAQAGVEHAKTWAAHNPGNTTSGWLFLGGGGYNFTVSGWGSARNHDSVGQVLDGSGNIIAERRLTYTPLDGQSEQ